MTRVLVCGGRAYDDQERVFAVLSKLRDANGIDAIIQGGAHGADYHAREWAKDTSTPCETFEADWENQGSFAGPMRNKRMLTEGRPDLVIAFPTPGARNKGTHNMMDQARKHGVKVIEIAP